MDNHDNDDIVDTCRKYGDDDPQLWIQALSYFSKLKRADGCQKEIEQILKCNWFGSNGNCSMSIYCYDYSIDIDENDLLSPLLIVQTLSNNESTTLNLLKVGRVSVRVKNIVVLVDKYVRIISYENFMANKIKSIVINTKYEVIVKKVKISYEKFKHSKPSSADFFRLTTSRNMSIVVRLGQYFVKIRNVVHVKWI
jgi:hypothetical protein